MTERGMIFNAEMVRSVLDGRKTQTRRICSEIDPSNFPACLSKRQWAKVNKDLPVAFGPDYFCPFGAVGDLLWVRETWMPDAPRDGTWADVEFYGCKGSPLSMIPKRFRKPEHCIHRASWNGSEMVGWTPSIHMPRWASRITLEITGVRVERLRDLSEEDAKSEGIIPSAGGVLPGWEHRINFRDLWMRIYGADNWEANPWVWVIEFKRVEDGSHD